MTRSSSATPVTGCRPDRQPAVLLRDDRQLRALRADLPRGPGLLRDPGQLQLRERPDRRDLLHELDAELRRGDPGRPHRVRPRLRAGRRATSEFYGDEVHRRPPPTSSLWPPPSASSTTTAAASPPASSCGRTAGVRRAVTWDDDVLDCGSYLYYAWDEDEHVITRGVTCPVSPCGDTDIDPNEFPFETQMVPLTTANFDLPAAAGWMLLVFPPSYDDGPGTWVLARQWRSDSETDPPQPSTTRRGSAPASRSVPTRWVSRPPRWRTLTASRIRFCRSSASALPSGAGYDPYW